MDTSMHQSRTATVIAHTLALWILAPAENFLSAYWGCLLLSL